MTLTASTVMISSRAAKRKSQGYVKADAVPSWISVPSDTSGGCTPKPKNDRPLSARIAPPTLRVASMMRNDDMLGSRCRKMILRDGTPMNRAACTNSRSRSERVRPRTIRAVIIQEKAASSTTNSSHVLPRNCGDRMAMMRNEGSTRSRSTIHMRIRSTQPPK